MGAAGMDPFLARLLAPPEAPPRGWAGLSMGLVGSYGFGSANDSTQFILNGRSVPYSPVSPSVTTPSLAGGLVGVSIGRDWQFGPILAGVTGDISVGRLGGSTTGPSGKGPGGVEVQSLQSAAINALGTLRGDLGFAVLDRVMAYGTGGLALGAVEGRSTVTFPATGANYVGTRTATAVGWVAGGGVRYAINDIWSVGIEYLHDDLGTTSTLGYQSGQSSYHTQSDLKLRNDMARVRLDYAFAPVSNVRRYVATPDADAIAKMSLLAILRQSDWEFGTRYWYSTGTMRYKLYGYDGSTMLSQLTYSGLKSSAGELFGGVSTPAGVIVRGVLGAGSGSAGQLKDEDFPPGISPYSATVSGLKGGSVGYAMLDVEYDVMPWLRGQLGDLPRMQMGPLVGYGYWHQQMNAYGCTEIAANPDVCSGVSNAALGISEDNVWNYARLGVAVSADLGAGFSVLADAAWVPYGGLSGSDTHWLRLNNPSQGAGNLGGPIAQSGAAFGAQAQLLVRYQVSGALDLGVGGRYWQLNSNGSSKFVAPNGASGSQPTHYTAERYGPFLQLSLRY